jgi:hypothetical protein
VKIFSLDVPILFFSPSSPVRIPGWPMSSLEGPVEFNKPHSDMSEEEKLMANKTIDQALAKAIEELNI